jgi:hypothetical protein
MIFSRSTALLPLASCLWLAHYAPSFVTVRAYSTGAHPTVRLNTKLPPRLSDEDRMWRAPSATEILPLTQSQSSSLSSTDLETWRFPANGDTVAKQRVGKSVTSAPIWAPNDRIWRFPQASVLLQNTPTTPRGMPDGLQPVDLVWRFPNPTLTRQTKQVGSYKAKERLWKAPALDSVLLERSGYLQSIPRSLTATNKSPLNRHDLFLPNERIWSTPRPSQIRTHSQYSAPFPHQERLRREPTEAEIRPDAVLTTLDWEPSERAWTPPLPAHVTTAIARDEDDWTPNVPTYRAMEKRLPAVGTMRRVGNTMPKAFSDADKMWRRPQPQHVESFLRNHLEIVHATPTSKDKETDPHLQEQVWEWA